MESTDPDQAALQFIAEGVTELAGFEVAAISVVRDGLLHTVAVAGSDEALAELAGRPSPVEALLAELENAEDWGLLKFVPHEREGGHLADYSWIPELEVSDLPDAWHPHDMLCGLLYDASGTLRGLLAIDLPRNGRRPGPEQRRILQIYVKQAERAVITALERGAFARDLERERAMADYRASLITVLSHEVQNPLTAILHNAELLLEEGAGDELTVQGLEAIRRGAGRIRSLGEDLLVLARVDHPDRPLADVVDLGQVAREVVELLAAEAEHREVDVQLLPAGGDLLVTGDAQDLDALVANLVGNAIKYSDPGGLVQVRLRRVEEDGVASVKLVVCDRGFGISEDDRQHVFEEFFRSSDDAVRARPGTGLGLAIVDRVVARHGGTIDMDSTPGRGTTVRVWLPAVR